LPEFGYTPVIVTAHWRHYQEKLDWELLELTPDVDTVRTRALPPFPGGLIGDLGLRSLPAHFRELSRMASAARLDFVHITIPSNYSALLGRMIYRRYGVPYGIDYGDPWVSEDGMSGPRLTKAWASAQLARVLEPWAVREARLITGVAETYFEGVLRRSPHLKRSARTAATPFGGAVEDFDRLAKLEPKPLIFDPEDPHKHLLYAGTIWPRGLPVFRRLLEGVAELRTRDPDIYRQIRLHFIGSGRSPSDPNGFNALPIARQLGIDANVTEDPLRMSFVRTLDHQRRAHANLVVGSTDAHYLPSKILQLVHAKRPIFAMLHRESPAARQLQQAHAARLLLFGSEALPRPAEVADALSAFVRSPPDLGAVDWSAFERLSARESARVLAGAVDSAIALERSLRGKT
jgi:glycosyltransferase involved in cell wall biosynthesis